MKRIILSVIVLLAACMQNMQAEETLLMQQLREARKLTHLTLPLHEEHNAQGELTHLGVALFSKEHQEVLNPYLWRGAERMLLELLLKPNDKERQTWLRERGVRLFLQATTFGQQGFTNMNPAVEILKQITSIKINEEADRYKLLVTGGPEEMTLRLSFPKERELIYGTDKKEEDLLQAMRLKEYKGSPLPLYLPSTDDLLLTSTSEIYHTPGQALYIDSLRTDGYYQVTGQQVKAVYEAAYPKESVRNLLLGKLHRPELAVHVTHRQYGNQVIEWTTSWDNLLGALCSEEVMEPYAAAQYQADKRQLTGILILRNIAFGYNNMLLLSIPQDQLDSNREVTLEAMLYTNIPQHNILSLFEERTHKRSGNEAKGPMFNHKIR